MAIEPQPAPQQLVLPTFNVIGRPPALLARLGNSKNRKRHRTPSPEPMSFDAPSVPSPPAETRETLALSSRISNLDAPVPASPITLSVLGHPNGAVPSNNVSGASSQTSSALTSAVPDPPLMTPVIASAHSASVPTTDAPESSPVSPSFDKGNEPIVGAPRGFTAAAHSRSSPANAFPSSSRVSDNPSSATATSATDFDYPSFEAFLDKRAQSLAGVHSQNATRAKQWADQSQETVTAGDTLLGSFETLCAEAQATMVQAARAREEAARAEQMAIGLQTRVQEGLSLAKGLQEHHARNRDLANKVQRYSEELKTWDVTTGEKERGFIRRLRDHRQAEDIARSHRANELARHEAARAEEDAARAQREAAARASEREELIALRAELEATKKKELALAKKVDVLQRANDTFLASVEGLRAHAWSSGANDEARTTIDQHTSAASTSAQPTSPVTPIASVYTAAISGFPKATSSSRPEETSPGLIQTTQTQASPTSAVASTSRPSMSSYAARETASPAQATARSLVRGFVPAQTEAGRALDTQRPLASTVRASGSRSASNSPESQHARPLSITRGPSTAASPAPLTVVSPEVIVKSEPESIDADLSQAISPGPTLAQTQSSVPTAASTPLVNEPTTPAPAMASAPQPVSATSSRASPPARRAASSIVSKPAPPPPARQPEPLREPSPMGPGYDGDAHTMMAPDHDMDDRRSYDSHSETHTEVHSPTTQHRLLDLRLPPKPKVQPVPAPNSICPGGPASQSRVERADIGPFHKKLDRSRGGPLGAQPSQGSNSHSARNIDAHPSALSIPVKRPYDDDNPRQRWEDRRRRLSPGLSESTPNGAGQASGWPARSPPGRGQGDTQCNARSPSYENGPYSSRPIEGGSDQRSIFPPYSPPAADGRFNVNTGPPNSRNARPQPDTYRPQSLPEHLARGPDHWSPARYDRDSTSPFQQWPLRADTYRPPPPEPAPPRKQSWQDDGPPRRYLPPRPASPRGRPAPRNDIRPQQSALQARIPDVNDGERSGLAPSESRPTLEERLRTAPTPLRIGDDEAAHQPPSYHDDYDNAGDSKKVRRTRGGAGRNPARGRGGRANNNGQGGQRRHMSSDDSPGAVLLGRISMNEAV